MKLLLVEDEAPKRKHIAQFLESFGLDFDINFSKSVRSAMDFFSDQAPDLVLLDMSLPTFDISSEETGGRPQGFGGIEILRYMERLDISCPVIVITAYEAFSHEGNDVDLSGIKDKLESDFPDMFRGLVYYNPVFDDWSNQLQVIVEGVVEEINNNA